MASVRALASELCGYWPSFTRARFPSFGDVKIKNQVRAPLGVTRRLRPGVLASK
jgi:hypothetical protein